jgi:hypothetical protein
MLVRAVLLHLICQQGLPVPCFFPGAAQEGGRSDTIVGFCFVTYISHHTLHKLRNVTFSRRLPRDLRRLHATTWLVSIGCRPRRRRWVNIVPFDSSLTSSVNCSAPMYVRNPSTRLLLLVVDANHCCGSGRRLELRYWSSCKAQERRERRQRLLARLSNLLARCSRLACGLRGCRNPGLIHMPAPRATPIKTVAATMSHHVGDLNTARRHQRRGRVLDATLRLARKASSVSTSSPPCPRATE